MMEPIKPGIKCPECGGVSSTISRNHKAKCSVGTAEFLSEFSEIVKESQ